MKKLLVFLSIFGVLFVSTIRPLQAEYLDDDFMLVNGRTYYFIIDEELIINDYTIGYREQYPLCSISFMVVSDYLDVKLLVSYVPSTTSTAQSFDIELTYLGTIYDYITPNSTINGYVYSFVWTPPTINNIVYDDYLLAFDNENPLPPISIYDTIYALVNKYVFGNNIESGSHQDLTATILSTTICVLVFALPFLIIWKVIKIIMG